MSAESNGSISSDKLQEALQRAKQLAAQSVDSSVGQKRHATSGADDDHPAKRSANGMLGMDGFANPIATLGGSGGGMITGLPDVTVEQLEVPDMCVGLVIGRGGENINMIQSQSNCRIQMAPDVSGKNTRSCSLQGDRASIEKAKMLIMEVVNKAENRPPPSRDGGFGGRGGGSMAGIPRGMSMGGGGSQPSADGRGVTAEMMIPGTKCGLVIGKGGDMIKQLQDRAGVKMTLIQDSNETSPLGKPLRITGEADKVEFAKTLVEEILNSKDDHPPPRGGMNSYGGGGGGGYGGGGGGGYQQRSIGEVIVPKSSVGVIIGKGGENIKRIAMESGAKIQFKPESDDPSGTERTATIQGSPDQIARATNMISEMVNRAMSNDQPGGGGFGGRGGGGGGGGMGGGGGGEVFYMHVPITKTGLVIGKGGEVIRQISGESGARIELSREPPPNDAEKIFVIRGSAYQIHHAQHLVRIKVGDVQPGTPIPPFQGQGGGGGGGAYGGGGGPPQGYGMPQQNPYQQPWGGFGGVPQPQPQQPVADPNQAAWAQYYAQQQQFQNMAGGYPGAGAPQAVQPQVQQPQPVLQQQQPQAAAPAPTVNPTTGQPDYSAQWAEYYRNLGMHEQAALIEQQAKSGGGAAAGAAQPQVAVQQPAAQPQAFYGGGQPVAAVLPGGYGAAPAAAGGQFPTYPAQY